MNLYNHIKQLLKNVINPAREKWLSGDVGDVGLFHFQTDVFDIMLISFAKVFS